MIQLLTSLTTLACPDVPLGYCADHFCWALPIQVRAYGNGSLSWCCFLKFMCGTILQLWWLPFRELPNTQNLSNYRWPNLDMYKDEETYQKHEENSIQTRHVIHQEEEWAHIKLKLRQCRVQFEPCKRENRENQHHSKRFMNIPFWGQSVLHTAPQFGTQKPILYERPVWRFWQLKHQT